MLAADAFTPFVMGIDATGKAARGAGNTGVRGVMIAHEAKNAGDIVDIMTDGEIVEFGGVAGTSYTGLTTTGVVGTTAADATHIALGFTVEANRLIVRAAR